MQRASYLPYTHFPKNMLITFWWSYTVLRENIIPISSIFISFRFSSYKKAQAYFSDGSWLLLLNFKGWLGVLDAPGERGYPISASNSLSYPLTNSLSLFPFIAFSNDFCPFFYRALLTFFRFCFSCHRAVPACALSCRELLWRPNVPKFSSSVPVSCKKFWRKGASSIYDCKKSNAKYFRSNSWAFCWPRIFLSCFLR